MKGPIAIALLLVIVAGFYWKLILTDEYVWFDHSDMVYLELPRLEFQAREFQRGRFPLWDPHIWMGQPLIGQTQPGPLNPLNLIMMLWPLDEAGYLRFTVLNSYFVVMHMVAALGLYWLCRELKRTRGASILAACAFSFGGFVGSAPWLDVLSGALWTPWVTLFFLRAARGHRPFESAAIGGVMLGLAWLSGHHEIPLLVTLTLGGAWVAAVALARPPHRAALIARAAFMFTIAALVSAVQMWSTIEFGRLAMRWGPAGGPVGWKDKVPYLSAAIYSFTPRGIFGLAFPDAGTSGDTSAFMGVIVCALALLGLVAAWRHPAVRWLAMVAGGSLVFAMGDFTPVHGVLNQLVPGLNKARVPVRALHLLNFAAAVLVAYGIDRMMSGRAAKWRLWIPSVVALPGAAILLGVLTWNLQASEALLLSAFTSVAWLALAIAWNSPSRPLSREFLLGLALVLMMGEMGTTLTRNWRSRFEEKSQRFAQQLSAHRDMVEFLKREPSPNRVRINDQDVPPNFGDLHSIDMQEGYTAGVTSNLLIFGRQSAAAQQLFGITHHIGKQAELPDWPEVFAGEDGIKVFRNPHPLARARTVHRIEIVKTAALLRSRVEDPAFDPGAIALILGNAAPALETCAGDDNVAVEAYAPNRVRISTDMKCRGLLVLSDTYFPGWEATVDGKREPILEVYGGIRGIVIGGGRHDVDFRYRPTSVFGGAALCAAGLLVTLVVTVAGRRT